MTTQPMGHFQAVPWVGGSRKLFEVRERRYHPVTGAPAGVEAIAIRELPPSGGMPMTLSHCPHRLGLNCLKCYPVQYHRTNARLP